jgi:hypothetical protein
MRASISIGFAALRSANDNAIAIATNARAPLISRS